MSTLNLDRLLNPRSLAVVGASDRPGSPGRALAGNLLDGDFAGTLHFVNPRYREVLGQPCLKRLADLPDVPDLLLFIAPARIVRRTLVQVARQGIKVMVIMSPVDDSRAMHRLARELGVRLLGPYCAGIVRPHLGLNATYSVNRIAPGPLAIVSQSASLGAAILDWAEATGVGFSALLSTGDDTDVSLADLLDLLAEDYRTRAIIVYLDRINGTRAFLSAISAAARIKPVVLMKSTQYTSRYCDLLTRTADVYSSDTVMEAALSRAGVVRIRSFSNLFAAAKILSLRIRVDGKRIGIISNGAAPAMLACQRAESKGFSIPLMDLPARDTGGRLLPVSTRQGTITGLNPFVLRLREGLESAYVDAVEALVSSKLFDAIVVIHIPDSRHDPLAIARAVAGLARARTPLLTCWMGEASVADSRDVFIEANIVTFRTPEAAIDGFDFLHRYHANQQLLLQLPGPAGEFDRADVTSARALLRRVLDNGHRVLGPLETRRLLSLFGIDVLPSRLARTVEMAGDIAEDIGYPVAMKIYSPNVTYKAAVTGTRLNVGDRAMLGATFDDMRAQLLTLRPDAEFSGVLIEPMYEPDNQRSLAISLQRDPTFGPIISVGIGDDLAALLPRRKVQLPPLNRFLIADMLDSPEISTYLGRFRHQPPVARGAIEQALQKLSDMATELPDLYSLHVSPLLVSDDRAVALSVQAVVERRPLERRHAHLAIQPFPWNWVRTVSLKGDRRVILRPVRPEDGESMQALVRGMSAESRYFRFMHAINELSPQMVAQFTKLDYDRQMAFVAIDTDDTLVGVSRYATSNDRQRGEFAVSVADDWKGRGLASALMHMIMDHAREHGVKILQGDVLRSNRPMQGLMQSLGFEGSVNPEDRDVLLYMHELASSAVDDPSES